MKLGMSLPLAALLLLSLSPSPAVPQGIMIKEVCCVWEFFCIPCVGCPGNQSCSCVMGEDWQTCTADVGTPDGCAHQCGVAVASDPCKKRAVAKNPNQ